MENGKWKTENKNEKPDDENFSTLHFPFSIGKLCSACGAEAKRINAKFCHVCGKVLREDYEPLDNLRSSYRLQGKSFLIENAKKEDTVNLFQRDENAVSQIAWACVVYSFVPYLGILFVPFAFIIGSFGYVVSRRQPHLGGRKLALVCVALSFVVLAAQIFLWCLLYIIPELGKQV